MKIKQYNWHNGYDRDLHVTWVKFVVSQWRYQLLKEVEKEIQALTLLHSIFTFMRLTDSKNAAVVI